MGWGGREGLSKEVPLELRLSRAESLRLDSLRRGCPA